MQEYVQEVLVPYLNQHRSIGQKALLVLDVLAAHRTRIFIDLLQKNDICVVFVPGGCTSELQPLDVAVNDEFKKQLKEKFMKWYSNQVQHDITSPEEPSNTSADNILATSKVKHVHAGWVMTVVDELMGRADLIRDAFQRAGITPQLLQREYIMAQTIVCKVIHACKQYAN